ncbi:hypothetical protein SAMN05444064_1591, partial [Pseudomonas syringae]
NPLASAWNSLEPAQSKEGLATAYQMQGNNEAAAAIRNQGNVEFGLNLIPVERVVSLGKWGAVAKGGDEFGFAGKSTEELFDTPPIKPIPVPGDYDFVGSKVTPPTPHASIGATADNEVGGFSYYDQFKKADGSWDWPEN